jgi:hypothetical protein
VPGEAVDEPSRPFATIAMVRTQVGTMNANSKSDTYTMPKKQLLKLLETTADETPRKARRPRGRADGKSAANELAEPQYYWY